MVAAPKTASEYRTRLIGLLSPHTLSDAIALAICSRILHTPAPRPCYSEFGMEDPFEAYHEELVRSDRDPKTIVRYWQVIKTYQRWLGDGQPSVETAKRFIAWLRENGYRPKSVLLYYHALKIFHDFISQPFRLKLRKEKTLPPYYDRGDVEALIAQASKGLRGQKEWQKKRNEALIMTLAYTGMRKSELLNLLVGDVDLNRKVIMIRKGKGNKDRVIPVAERIVVPLRLRCEGKGLSQLPIALKAGVTSTPNRDITNDITGKAMAIPSAMAMTPVNILRVFLKPSVKFLGTISLAIALLRSVVKKTRTMPILRAIIMYIPLSRNHCHKTETSS